MAGVALKGYAVSGETGSSYNCVARDRDCVSWNTDDEGNRTSCAVYGDWYCTSTSSSSVEGTISEGSSFVTVNGTGIAINGSATEETANLKYDDISNGSGSGTGSVSQGSGFVTINGTGVAEKGYSVNLHSGTGQIDKGSSFVTVQ